MTPSAVLLAALLAHPLARCEPAECADVVRAAVAASVVHRVPARVLVGVALVESGARSCAVGPFRRGGYALGAWQLWAPHRPILRAALASRAGLGAGAMGAAKALADSRRKCARMRSKCVCVWSCYNFNARTEWCRRLRRALRDLPRAASQSILSA